jgi:hypothetical protein
MSIPGLQPPNPLLAEYYTLQAAIASGARSVRFQDRTIEYQSIDDLIKASNYLYLKLAGMGLLPSGLNGGAGGVNRQIRCYTNKGL